MERRNFISTCIAALAGLVGWKGQESPLPPNALEMTPQQLYPKAVLSSAGEAFDPPIEKPNPWLVIYGFENKHGAYCESFSAVEEFNPYLALRLLGKPATLVINGVSLPDMTLTRIEYSRNGFTEVIEA